LRRFFKKMTRQIHCHGCGERTTAIVGSADEDRFFRVGSPDGKLFYCDPVCWIQVRKDSKPPARSLLTSWYEKQGSRYTREEVASALLQLGYGAAHRGAYGGAPAEDDL
jgi:hypothetical protein